MYRYSYIIITRKQILSADEVTKNVTVTLSKY